MPGGAALPVLLTRPPAQGARFSQDLARRFGPRLRLIEAPLLAPVLLAPPLPEGPFQALILTSETGVRAAMAAYGPVLPRLAFCVGDRTAAVAQAMGLQARSAQGDAEALVALIAGSGQPGPFLHLRGQDSRGDVAGQLAARGLPVAEVVVYRQEAQPLTMAAQQALAQAAADGGPVIVPLFSPRTAALFAQMIDALPVRPVGLWVIAMSAAVAAPVSGLAARVVIAARPDATAMADCIGGILSDPGLAT